IRVIAIVPDHHAVALEPLAAHMARGKGSHRIPQAFGWDAECLGHGNAGEEVRDRVSTRQHSVEIGPIHSEIRTARTGVHYLTTEVGVIREAERDRGARVYFAEARHPGIVRVQNGDSGAPEPL